MRLDRSRVYGLMQARGWKVADLWRNARTYKRDLAQSTVWNAANGRHDAALEVAKSLAAALGTSPEYLTGEIEDPNAPRSPVPEIPEELVPLIQHLASLPPMQRVKFTRAIAQLLDITAPDETGDKTDPEDITINVRTSALPEIVPASLAEALEFSGWTYEQLIEAMQRDPGREGHGAEPGNHRGASQLSLDLERQAIR